MACIDMFNPDHQSLCGGGGSAPPAQPMSPRISFSSDFLMEVPAVRAPGPPPDPNFEFLVGSRPMITADQLFFKGRLLPLKENCVSGSSRGVTTLRDELRGKDESGGGRERPPKASSKWKEFLGLKKSRSSAAKKIDKNENVTAAAAEDAHAHLDKSMQEL
ncbi:hypothetical protein Cni_G17536 [Canna indica]|uniref:Uncharacterized protein n=1 Tax=Canna indica TaxID=4628 RepID=A0AAQ3KKR8_9LILI|nr:hypothetical protein Cni_G17536 [Canna indica]